MRLEKLPTGIRITAEDEVYLDLTTAQYEDIFYALPLECSSLYLLLNGTVLSHADDRAILQFIVEANGGVDEAMKTLQALVQETPPPSASVVVEPPKPAESPLTAKAPAPPKVEEPADEPFEILVHPSKPAVDPFAEIVKPAKAEEKPFVIKEVPKPVKPAELKPIGGSEVRRPGTGVFEKKAPTPIKIEPQPDGKRVRITVGSKSLDLGVVRYEDLYYAVPGDNASLFRLINDTILNRPEERDALKDLLGLLGGIDSGMTALQEAVQKVEPPPKKAKSTAPSVAGQQTNSFGKSGSSAPAVGPKTQTFGGTTKPASTVQPGAPKSGVVVQTSKPGLPIAPVAPAAAAKTPVPAAGIKMPSPPTGGGLAKPPALPVAPAKPPVVPSSPAKPPSIAPKTVLPKGIPPKITGPIPFSVDVPDEVDEVELVDDVEEIPVAPVDGGRPGHSPAASKPLPASVAKAPGSMAKPGTAPPVSKAGAPAPAAAASMARKKGKEIDRPAGQAQIKMSKEDMDRTGVKVKAVPNVGYQIICKEYFIQLSKAQYQELHYALPMPVMNMFKLVHNDLLKDPQSRGVLMKMIHLAGGPKDFMSALSLQVQSIKPTEDWQ
ncbi:MAG: hypothetical protein AAB074_19680 [Planctomycetota bacterium]